MRFSVATVVCLATLVISANAAAEKDEKGFCLPFLCHRRLEVPYMYMYAIRAFKSTQIRRKRLRVSGALTRQKGTDLLLRLDTEHASVPWDNTLSLL